MSTLNLDFLPSGFFQILTGKLSQYYLKTIFIMHEYISGSEVTIRRELISRRVADIFSVEKFFDEEEQTEITRQDLPAYVLRKLREYGWIDEEIDNNYQRLLSFTKIGYRFVTIFAELSSEQSAIDTLPEVDYQSYIYTIYLYLRDYHQFEGKIVIERVHQEMRQLRSLLKELASSIKTYIERSLSHKDLETILKLHFDDYRQTIGYSYHLLKTSDNVAKFKIYIVEAIELILQDQDYLQQTAAAMILETKILDVNFFIGAIRQKLSEALSFFNYELEEIIKEIDYRHAEYIKSTINRFKYLSNYRQDVEGQINTILKYFTKLIHSGQVLPGISHEVSDRLINVSIGNFVDNRSLYKMRGKPSEFVPERVFSSEEDQSARVEELMSRIRKRQNKAKAGECANTLLGDASQINAATITLEDREDLIELINLAIYGKSPGSGYDIELLNKFVGTEFVTFKDFIIRRK